MTRKFRLLRTGFMVATVAAGTAVCLDPDGIPDGKWLVFWVLSAITLGMVAVEEFGARD